MERAEESGRRDGTERSPVAVARTAEPPRERPPWQGLFLEPDLPKPEEDDGA